MSDDAVASTFLESAIYRFQGAKELGDKALAQMRKGAQWQTFSIARGQSRQYGPRKRD